jgi:WS/DGAT/MGAT family acyltransferase
VKQLTGLDASFLYLESATTYGHVSGLAIYERPSPDFDPYEAVRARMAAMIGRAEPFRRRLVEVPLQLDHPYWIDDPHFDLDFHVRHLGLAPPGAADQLAEQVARIVSRPLDRSRPLWEMYVIEGLGDGRWATLTKTHHATIDGASGVILLSMLTDTTPDAAPLEPVEWHGEPIPSDTMLLERTMRHLVANPLKAARVYLRLGQTAATAAGITNVGAMAERARRLLGEVARSGAPAEPEHERSVALPISPAPPTPWNHRISGQRRFAMRSASLENIKALKNATGGTVNDIVMAICAGALREYLLRHDALPDQPLRAMVPVSIRTGDEADPWTNRVSAIFADLPTDCDDPLERVQRCCDAMAAAKHQLDLVPAETLADITQTASPVVATAAIRLVSRLADRINLPANVVISNVPGPRVPLYFAGAKLDHYIPVSTIADNMGLNITVHSYLDQLDFGIIACRELVPDVWDLVDLHIEEISRLFEASGAVWAEPPRPPSGRRAVRASAPAARPARTRSTRAPRAVAAPPRPPRSL